MKRRMGFALGAGGLLFLARWADLIFWTDPATGLCTVGSVWWRYGGLALACGLALWAGQKLPGPPEGLWGRHPAAAGLSRAAGEAFLLAGAARALTLGPGAAALLRAALEALCGVWLFALGRSWSKEGARPTRSMGWAVAGSLSIVIGRSSLSALAMDNALTANRAAKNSFFMVLKNFKVSNFELGF